MNGKGILLFAAMFMAVLLVLAGLMAPAAAQGTAPTPTPPVIPGLRTYQAPDLAYRFEYPLDPYSVRQGCTCTAPDGGSNILFPGVIALEPNDSALYGEGGYGTLYRMSIAAVPAPDGAALDTTLLGLGPLMQYDAARIAGLNVQQIALQGVPALRVDGVPTGPAGTLTDIVALHEGLLYEILIEPPVTRARARPGPT